MSRKKNTTTENAGMQTNDATEAGNATETTPAKTKIKRPRAGSWTPVVRQIPIPGTQDADGNALTTPVEFYVVEFCGETIEVLRNRDGAKRASEWIRNIRAGGEERLRVDTIRRKLEEMSEAATTQEMTARLYTAARVLAGDDAVFPGVGDPRLASDQEPTA